MLTIAVGVVIGMICLSLLGIMAEIAIWMIVIIVAIIKDCRKSPATKGASLR